MVTTLENIKITKQLDLGLDDILKGISELDTPVLESFMQKLGYVIARKKVVSLPERESQLLLKINTAISSEMQEHYENLLKKNQNETISSDEHEELVELIDEIEIRHVQRLECLIELSRLRGVALEELMKQLHLNSHRYD